MRADGVHHCRLDRSLTARVHHGQFPGSVHTHSAGFDQDDERCVDHPVRAAGEEGYVVDVEPG